MPLKSISGLSSAARFSLDPSFGSSWARRAPSRCRGTKTGFAGSPRITSSRRCLHAHVCRHLHIFGRNRPRRCGPVGLTAVNRQPPEHHLANALQGQSRERLAEIVGRIGRKNRPGPDHFRCRHVGPNITRAACPCGDGGRAEHDRDRKNSARLSLSPTTLDPDHRQPRGRQVTRAERFGHSPAPSDLRF